MSGETVLIAAFSARALAQSARRAGFQPLVVDAFGDLDTRAASLGWRPLDGEMERGFTTKPLVAALESLRAAAPTAPAGLVLGSGFEDKPELVARLASRYRLIGASAQTINAVNDPASLFPTLDRLSVAHPETRSTPPTDLDGGSCWLSKRSGGSGGRHIRYVRTAPRSRRRRYFQRQLDGDRLSIGGLFAPGGSSLSLTRQWIAPSPKHPFRYGGAVSMPVVDHRLFSRMADGARRVASHYGLIGMASFDFVVSDGTPHLLDVNPRPGATLDILDDDSGSMFRAHVHAHLSALDAIYLAPHKPRDVNARAALILHADPGAVTLGEIPWPEWSADRGASGSRIPQGAPLATVFANGATAEEAERLARARLAELQDLIYGNSKHS